MRNFVSTHKRQLTLIVTATTLILSVSFAGAAEKPAKKKAGTATVAPTESVDTTAEQVKDSGPQLKFNAAEEPPQSDYRGGMKFSDKSVTGGEQAVTPPSNQTAAPEEGFRTYIGYPKHEVGLITSFQNISATWGYNGQEFNFSTSALAYGIGYNFIGTPQWKLGIEYSRYSVSAPAGTASGFIINDSDADLDQYGISTEYCSISATNFYRQYCLGGTIANDAYPVLKFTDGTNLVMSSVTDIVVGVHAAMQIPITEKVLFKPILGYNYGTGAGSSGALTPKSNSMLYFRGEIPWYMNQNWTFKFHGDYSSRQATIEGKIGANTDKWETDSTMLGGGLDVLYVF